MTVADKPLRSDAARNVDRILRAARAVYSEAGPDAHLDLVARRAGVGERTLYRRFPTKRDLIRAALDQSISETLLPAIETARQNHDPLLGLSGLIEAAIALGSGEHHLLAAARRVDALDNISDALDDALAELTARAQADGLVRSDLVAVDLPRIIAMLNSVLWTMAPDSDGWRRYVALMLDAIATPAPRRLPPVVPLPDTRRAQSWPL